MNKLVQLEYGGRCPFCSNTTLHHVDSEVVCSRCGAVLGYDYDGSNGSGWRGNVNLYNSVRLGCSANDPPDGRQLMRERDRHLSLFSNLCEKLFLPRHIALECWRNYRRLLRCTEMGAAELALLVIHMASKRYSMRRSYDEVRDAVASIYGRRSIPTIERILSNFADEVYRCRDADRAELYMEFLGMDERSRRRAKRVLSLLNGVDLRRVIDIAY
ncbi:MAG: TFIIB-type zinc ribbon-containing protein [Candidatus Nitrosocaldus sp.]|nr:TFIIB-type zinc ribbon-containing protein [Candidatus Nitrosocaldus sp.]MDW8000531.1 TFIIB-type zinc ribbon-containing protein [Candidatus Nitrosocaldus sp.]